LAHSPWKISLIAAQKVLPNLLAREKFKKKRKIIQKEEKDGEKLFKNKKNKYYTV